MNMVCGYDLHPEYRKFPNYSDTQKICCNLTLKNLNYVALA